MTPRRTEPLRLVAAPDKASVPTPMTAPASPGASPSQLAPSSPDLIAAFLELEIEARLCQDLDQLRFAITNSSARVAGHVQAFLVEPSVATGRWSISRVSDVSDVDANSPFIQSLNAWLRHPLHAGIIARGVPRHVDIEKEKQGWSIAGEAMLFAHAYWLPIKGRDGTLLAALVAMKAETWSSQAIAMALPLAGVYGHAWEALLPRNRSVLQRAGKRLPRRVLAFAIGLAASIAAFAPVPLTVLAQSEIAAVDPILVTAPIDGVVSEILQSPGALVESNVPLVRFVDVKFRNDFEVASRNVAVAEARFFKIMQSATAVQKDAAEIATAKAELEVAEAELAYASEVLSRTEIRAQKPGVLIYSTKSDWLGKPVSTGERIMEIGDPARVEIRIDLPVSDAIVLKPGNSVSLFLDGDPLRSIAGTVTRTSYRPVMSADQQLVFRIHARFDDVPAHRIGLRGMARISGENVSLWFYLLRRPIATVRQRLGL